MNRINEKAQMLTGKMKKAKKRGMEIDTKIATGNKKSFNPENFLKPVKKRTGTIQKKINKMVGY